MMKNKGSSLMKKVMTALTAMAKAKTLALKNKAHSLRTKLIIFSLLSNKKFLISSFSHKLHTFFTNNPHIKLDNIEEEDDETAAIVLHSGTAAMARDFLSNPTITQQLITAPEEPVIMKTTNNEEEDDNDDDDDDDDDDKYPDLTHSLFDLEDPGGSVIDMVKHSKEEAGESFCLEEEIDHVADLFIKRFHRQMKLQKMNSFKEFQDRIQRGI